MGIPVDFSFDRLSSNPIDSSLVLTKAEMVAMNDNVMPDQYFAVCKDDSKFYIYDKNNTPNQETGKYRLLDGSGGDTGMTTDLLWEVPSDATVNPETITLSKPMTDYDQILVIGFVPSGDKSHLMSGIYLPDDIINPVTRFPQQGTALGLSDQATRYIWYDVNSATQLTIRYGSNNLWMYRIYGITFGSKLDGTIGRWEKIGEYVAGGSTTLSIPNFADYNAFCLSVKGSPTREDNSAVILASQWEVGTPLQATIISGEYITATRTTDTTITFSARNAGVLYGYKETGISDADVRRIAAQASTPAGGTTGQVLTKKSDADFDADWQTPVADYNDLTGLPTINAYVIEGDKTSEDYDLQHKLTAGHNINIDANYKIDAIPTAVNKVSAVLWEGSITASGTNVPLSIGLDEFDEIEVYGTWSRTANTSPILIGTIKIADLSTSVPSILRESTPANLNSNLTNFGMLKVDDTNLRTSFDLNASVYQQPRLSRIVGVKYTDGMYRYSTNEMMVGQWIDGKPIYQTTVSFSFSSSTISNHAHGIQNIDKIVGVEAYMHNYDMSQIAPVDTARSYVSKINVRSGGYVNSISGWDNLYNAVYTIRYTKL